MPLFKLMHKESGNYLECGEYFVNETAPLLGVDASSASTWVLNQPFDGNSYDTITTVVDDKTAAITQYDKLNRLIDGKLYLGTMGATGFSGYAPLKFSIRSQNGSQYIYSDTKMYLTMVQDNATWGVFLAAQPAEWILTLQ